MVVPYNLYGSFRCFDILNESCQNDVFFDLYASNG